MLIDTHCHLDFPEFDADREAVIQRAGVAGVGYIINIGSSLLGSRSSVSLAAQYPNIFAGVGIHPHDAKECSPEALIEIEGLARDKKVVAVGEVGLDYFRNITEPRTQTEVFGQFARLALKLQLPLVVHSRRAEEDTLAVLREFDPGRLAGVVIHCFSGGQDFLRRCLALGMFVSFTCNVTYKKAQDLRRRVEEVPLERMFLETDAPFLPPEGRRGRRNEPACVSELAREIARVKQIDFQKVCFETTKNAKVFFGLERGQK